MAYGSTRQIPVRSQPSARANAFKPSRTHKRSRSNRRLKTWRGNWALPGSERPRRSRMWSRSSPPTLRATCRARLSTSTAARHAHSEKQRTLRRPPILVMANPRDDGTQPLMRGIRIEAWMPEQRDGEGWNGEREGEVVQTAPQALRVPLRNSGDHVGLTGEDDRGTEPTDGDCNPPRQSKRFERVIHRGHFEPSPRNQYMRTLGVALGCHLSATQWVTLPNHADEPVAEQPLRADLRPHGLARHAGFEVDHAVAQRRAVLVELRNELKVHVGCFRRDAREHRGPEGFDETLRAADGERARKRLEVQLQRRAQNGLRIIDDLVDAITQFQRARCRHQPAPSTYQQRVARGIAQPCERATHC